MIGAAAELRPVAAGCSHGRGQRPGPAGEQAADQEGRRGSHSRTRDNAPRDVRRPVSHKTVANESDLIERPASRAADQTSPIRISNESHRQTTPMRDPYRYTPSAGWIVPEPPGQTLLVGMACFPMADEPIHPTRMPLRWVVEGPAPGRDFDNPDDRAGYCRVGAVPTVRTHGARPWAATPLTVISPCGTDKTPAEPPKTDTGSAAILGLRRAGRTRAR